VFEKFASNYIKSCVAEKQLINTHAKGIKNYINKVEACITSKQFQDTVSACLDQYQSNDSNQVPRKEQAIKSIQKAIKTYDTHFKNLANTMKVMPQEVEALVNQMRKKVHQHFFGEEPRQSEITEGELEDSLTAQVSRHSTLANSQLRILTKFNQ